MHRHLINLGGSQTSAAQCHAVWPRGALVLSDMLWLSQQRGADGPAWLARAASPFAGSLDGRYCLSTCIAQDQSLWMAAVAGPYAQSTATGDN